MSDVPDVIQARKFELLGKDGTTRAVLCTDVDDSTLLILNEPNGGTRVQLTVHPGGEPRMIFRDKDGALRLGVGVAGVAPDEERFTITIYDKDTKVLYEIPKDE